MKNSTWQSFFCSHLKPIGGRLYARGRKISPLGIRVNVFPFQWSERSNSQIQNGKSSGFIGAALHTKVLTQSDLNIILFTSNPVQLYYQYIDTVQMCTVEQAYIYIYIFLLLLFQSAMKRRLWKFLDANVYVTPFSIQARVNETVPSGNNNHRTVSSDIKFRCKRVYSYWIELNIIWKKEKWHKYLNKQRVLKAYWILKIENEMVKNWIHNNKTIFPYEGQ